jgi:hypothetical protein
MTRMQERVGKSPRERLAWAVRAVQQPQKDLTPGDWSNLTAELTVFAYGRGFTAMHAPQAYRDQLQALAEDLPLPPQKPGSDFPMSQQAAKAALDRMGEIIAAAVRHEMVVITRGRVHALGWIPNFKKWLPLPGGLTFNERVAEALGHLLEQVGHLLKACPAPLPRDTEMCNTWFVASRPRQRYCSSTCQSRVTTRASRPKPRRKKEG